MDKSMNRGKAILILLRLPFLTVTIGAVLLGTGFAVWNAGRFHLPHFLLALLGSCFFHIATNVANDYFDFQSGNDASNVSGTAPFSGGSKMILDGFVSPSRAMALSVVFAVMGSLIGFYLNFAVRGNAVLFIGFLALILVYSYNGFPLRLVNKGLGELAIFTAWGPLIVLGSYYVQAENLGSVWPFVASIPSGILTTLVLLINEFADRDADASVGRKTWVILFGFRNSLRLYLALGFLCYIVVAAGVLFNDWPGWSLLVLVTLPFLLKAYSTALRTLGEWAAFLAAVKATILMNFLFLVILSLCFWI